MIYHPQVGGFLFEILSPELTFFFNGIEVGVGEILKIHPYVCINMYIIYTYLCIHETYVCILYTYLLMYIYMFTYSNHLTI